MFGFGKKLISVIFATGLLASNVFAADVRLSGSYIFSLTLTPPSESRGIPLIFQAKITPNKVGANNGKIVITRTSIEDIDGIRAVSEGDVVSYSSTPTTMAVSAPFVDWCAGRHLVSTNCSNESKFNVYYGGIDSNKVAHQAIIYGKFQIPIGVGVVNPELSAIAGLASIQQTGYITVFGSLIRQ